MEQRHERIDLAVPIERVSRPRCGEVAPLRQIPRCFPQPIDRAVLSAECGSAQARGARRRADRQGFPAASARTPRRTAEPTPARSTPRRADRRRLRPDARATGRRRRRGSCRRALPRAASAPDRDVARSSASCPASDARVSSRSRNRSLSSPAAFSVKVTATISPTLALPSAMMRTMRPTSAVVLPVPAAASTMSVVSRAVAMSLRASGSVSAGCSCGHGMPRSAARSPSGSAALRATCRGSSGPQIDRKSHHVHARSAGAARKKAELDGAVDDLERFESGAAVGFGQRDRMLGKPSGCRREEEAALPNGTAQDFLDRQAVDDRLKRASPANHRPGRRAVPARLVVGDAQLRRTKLGLDDVHRAAKDEAGRRSGRARAGSARRAPRRPARSCTRSTPASTAPTRAASGSTRADRVLSPQSRRATRGRSPARAVPCTPMRWSRALRRAPAAREAHRLYVSGRRLSECNARNTLACTSWKSEPRVSGSTR